MNIELRYSGPACSVNNWLIPSYRGGLTLSSAYAKFKDDLCVVFSGDRVRQKIDIVTTPVDITIYCRLPKKIDSDNILKPIIDAVEHAQIIKNDNLVQDIFLLRDQRLANPGYCDIFVHIFDAKKNNIYTVLG